MTETQTHTLTLQSADQWELADNLRKVAQRIAKAGPDCLPEPGEDDALVFDGQHVGTIARVPSAAEVEEDIDTLTAAGDGPERARALVKGTYTPPDADGMMTLEVIARPYGNGTIEVRGHWQGGDYEWRVLDDGGEVIHDTGQARYGSVGVALRDALNHEIG